MNLRTATLDQLRKERLRLTNMQRLLEQRKASNTSNRGGRNAGFRTGATNYQQDRELKQITTQLAQLDAEIAFREKRDAASSAEASAAPPATPDAE
jgi:hypothetical protein